MVCRVPLDCLGSLDPPVHGGLGVLLGLMETQASQALLEPKDTRAILDRRGTPENRGGQDLRAAQGPKVTLAGRGYLDL